MIDLYPTIKPVSAPEFIGFLRQAPRPGFLTQPSADELCEARCFLAIDQGLVVAGGYVRGEEIGGLFSHRPGRGAAVLHRLVIEGGRSLNCLGDGLRDYYTAHGFKVIAALPWRDDSAPEHWDYASDGRPTYYELACGRPLIEHDRARERATA